MHIKSPSPATPASRAADSAGPPVATAPRRRWRKPVAAFGAVGTSAALAVGLLGGAARASTTTSTTATTSTARPALTRPAGVMGAPRGRFGAGGPARVSFTTSASSTAGRPAVVGTVKSVGTASFTVTTKSGTVYTVDVSSSTAYRDGSVSSASLSEVATGETVAVVGTTSGDTVTATTVLIGAPPAASPSAQPTVGARPAGRLSAAPRSSGAPAGVTRGAMPLRR